MSIGFLFIWMIVLLLALSSAFGLAWAIKNGQFRDFQTGADSIFDADEPIGRATDFFPEHRGEPS
ncbi:MAG: hypothetical protein KJO07_17525 [Deltaproteobacteria bacterium]|nr:hypothetical protein [Deltaproteobacteria bacterium]